MKNNRTQFVQLTMTLLAFVTIGLCGRLLEVLINAEMRPELSFALALALISKGRAVYLCMLGSLILTCVLGVSEQKNIQTIAMLSVWSALTTLVYCKVSSYAIRSFLDTRWRSLLEVKDFIKLLIIGGFLSSLIPAAFGIAAITFLGTPLAVNLLIIELIQRWQETALAAVVFLPIFLGLVLRDTGCWQARYKAITLWGLVLVGFGCYLALTERQLVTFVSRTELAQQAAVPVKKIAVKIAEIEGAVIGFSQIAEIFSNSTPEYLSTLSQKIFALHPSIRSLSLVQDSSGPLSTRSQRYQVLQFSNPKYPKSSIDLDSVFLYMNTPMDSRSKDAVQAPQSFNLVRHREDGMIIAHETQSFNSLVVEAQSFNNLLVLDRKEPSQAKSSAFIDIDVTAFLSSENILETSNKGMPWTNLQVGMNPLPQKKFERPFSYRPSSLEMVEQRELATLKLFNQDLFIRATPSLGWLEKHIQEVMIPFTFFRVLLISLYMIFVFLIATRQTRWRVLFTKQEFVLRR